MRYRALTQTGDYTLGKGPSEFLVDTPATVAQAVLTALLLHQGEFFYNTSAGMPWETQVLGYGTQSLYDSAIKAEILGVQGVQSIINYSSSLNRSARALTVNAVLKTIFGTTAISGNIAIGAGGYGVQGFGGPGFYGG